MERQFPEFKLDRNNVFLGFHSTIEMMENYDFDLSEPWSRNAPSILFQLGALQSFMPQDESIDGKLFSNGQFEYKLGQQCNPAVKDIFKRHEDSEVTSKPVAPALLMRPENLDGTSAPSYEAAEKSTSIRNVNNITDNEHAERMQYRFKSPRNQPRVGELNNGTAPLYVNVDPRVKTKKKAIIWMFTEPRDDVGQIRNVKHKNTRFDPRHDPSLHFKAQQLYAVGEITKIGTTEYQVNTIDELNLTNPDGTPLTQAWLNEHLDYLNGNKELIILLLNHQLLLHGVRKEKWSVNDLYYHDKSLPGGFSMKTKISRISQNQRRLSENMKPQSKIPEAVKQERNLEKDKFDIQKMSEIKFTNEAAEREILIVWNTSSTGNFNVDARRLTCLQSKIPKERFLFRGIMVKQ